MNEQNSQIINNQVGVNAIIAPKWLSIIFRVYGLLIIISGGAIVIFSSLAPLVLGNKFNLLNFLTSNLPLLIYFLIIGYGSANLKRWIMPLFVIDFIIGLFFFFIAGDKIDFSQHIGSLTGIILFGVAYYKRQYFSGSYKNYIIQGLFVLVLAILSIAIFSPSILSSIKEEDIDKYIDSLSIEELFQDVDARIMFQKELEKKGIILDDEKISTLMNSPEILEIMKQSVKQDKDFRLRIRIIMESER